MNKANQRKKTDVFFNNCGYAENWFMSVGKCYKDQLDIKLTNIVRSKINKFSHLTDEEFTNYLKNNLPIHDFHIDVNKTKGTKKWRIRAWTQGQDYCFDRGNIIYKDNDETKETFAVQIDTARVANHNIRDAGEIVFMVFYCPNGLKYASASLGMCTLSQIKFVDFLKKGLPELKPLPGYDAAGNFHNTNISILKKMEGIM